MIRQYSKQLATGKSARSAGLLTSFLYGGGDPHFASVSLLMHGEGANGSTTFVDSSPSPLTYTALSGAQIATAQKKFGSASMVFGGNASATTPANSRFDLGSGDFTLEAWVYPTSNVAYGMITSQNPGQVTGSYELFINSGTLGTFISSNGSTWDISLATLSGGSVPLNTWTHVAMTRLGTSFKLWVGGVNTSTLVSAAAIVASNSVFAVGGRAAGIYGFPGYIDELRLTKGVCRYTANFTPPTEAFLDY